MNTTSSEEIERVVQVVLQRLRDFAPLTSQGIAEQNSAAQAEQVTQHKISDTALLVLNDPVISVATIQDRLAGIKQVCVPIQSVVTPAVKDLLRGKQIAISRVERMPQRAGSQSMVTSGSRPALVCGTATWLNSVAKQIPSLVDVKIGCETNCLESISRHLQCAGNRVLWVADRPFAAACQASKNGHAFAQITVLADLECALDETGAELIIVNARNWTVAAVCNLVRAWMRRS